MKGLNGIEPLLPTKAGGSPPSCMGLSHLPLLSLTFSTAREECRAEIREGGALGSGKTGRTSLQLVTDVFIEKIL